MQRGESVRFDENKNPIWCEECGERHAETFNDYAVMCLQCSKKVKKEVSQ
jgi:Zn finger protein HypA/HybF involved in hydrogenase expression